MLLDIAMGSNQVWLNNHAQSIYIIRSVVTLKKMLQESFSNIWYCYFVSSHPFENSARPDHFYIVPDSIPVDPTWEDNQNDYRPAQRRAWAADTSHLWPSQCGCYVRLLSVCRWQLESGGQHHMLPNRCSKPPAPTWTDIQKQSKDCKCMNVFHFDLKGDSWMLFLRQIYWIWWLFINLFSKQKLQIY